MPSDTTLADVQRAAADLNEKRKAVEKSEAALATIVCRYLDQHHAGARELARQMGFSAAYVSDVKNLRRKISGQFLTKLMELNRK